MTVWSSVLIAIAVASGLEADLPFVQWSRAWLALETHVRIGYGLLLVAAIALLTRPLLGRRDDAMRDVLPLTRTQRFAIDTACSAIFLSPPYVAWLLLAPRVEVVALYAVAILLNDMGKARVLTLREPRRFSRYELRWIPVSSVLATHVIALLLLGASELAIRNNSVTRPESIARIASFFAAIAMTLAAASVIGARNTARPFRTFERTLPLSSRQHVRAAIGTGVLLFAPAILFHARVFLFALLTLIALLLFGEHRSLRDARTAMGYVWLTGAAFALIGAIHAHLGIVAAAIAIPPFVLMAERSDAIHDTP